MIGSGTLTKTLASYFARVDFNALDDDALRVTKEHILYTLGTVLAGSSAPGAQEVLAGARAFGAAQESTVLPCGEKLPAPAAALVNASMAHSREWDINDTIASPTSRVSPRFPPRWRSLKRSAVLAAKTLSPQYASASTSAFAWAWQPTPSRRTPRRSLSARWPRR